MVAMLAGGCALLPQDAADPGAASADLSSSLRLVVEAPDDLRSLLEQYLDLARVQRLRGDEAVDDAEWTRLAAAAPAQARELLQTEGYFEAQASVQRRVDDGRGRPLQQVTLRVTPGPRTVVASISIETRGELQQRAAQGEAEALALQQALAAAGALQQGQPFRNTDWSQAKQQLLSRLRAAGYAAPRLADTRADIDVLAQRADLHLLLASGPLFLAGPLQIEGLKLHDDATVRHLAGFAAGTPLTEARLLDYQERLQKAGLFESASVSFEADASRAAATPLRVRLTELSRQQATVGLGVSANTGPRATLEHRHRRLLGLPVTAYNKIEWGRDKQSWTGDFLTHPGEGFYRNLLGVQVDKVKSSTDVVLSQRVRLGRTQDTPRIERLYFGELLHSQQTDSVPVTRSSPSPNTATALSANYHLVWRDLDSLLLPTRGRSMSLQLSAGESTSPGGGTGPFARLYGRFTGYLPLGQTWFGQARLELGQIIKSDKVTVPDAMGFRAGGDDSVRGYAYRSLTPTGSDGGTVSGPLLLTTSVELARPILPSQPAVWGAVFVDAGRAVAHWRDYKPALGYGVGLRWRSPIGPLKIDLAYGEELRKVRLHFTVGVTF